MGVWCDSSLQSNRIARVAADGICSREVNMTAIRRPSLLTRLLSRIRREQLSRASGKPAFARPFQAIAIYRGSVSCELAKRFSDYRFLAREAPALPLEGCTMRATCQCRYLKFNDRRSYQRRNTDFTTTTRPYLGKERRHSNGRRATDG